MKPECKWFQVCPIKRFYEKGKLDRKWIDQYCEGEWWKCKRFHMEEVGKAHSDSMLPNGKIDKRLEGGLKKRNAHMPKTI